MPISPAYMAGILPEGVAVLSAMRATALHIPWSCLILDTPVTFTQLQEIGALDEQGAVIQSRIDLQLQVNREAQILLLVEERARLAHLIEIGRQEIADARGRRDERVVRFQTHLPMGATDDDLSSKGQSSDSSRESSSPDSSGDDSSDDEVWVLAEYHGSMEALLKQLEQSDSSDEDSHVRFRHDWHERGNILGDRQPGAGRL